jgi:radical SAM superfamily enzyme YgiQ (UPF0313 family)
MPIVRATTGNHFDPVHPRLPGRSGKAKVLLVDPAMNGAFPSLGVITLTSSLLRAGVETAVEHFYPWVPEIEKLAQEEQHFYNRIGRRIVDEGFNLVGVTNVVSSSARAFKVARAAKAAGAMVMMGGPNITLTGGTEDGLERLGKFAEAAVDIYGFGYGERSIVALAQCLEDGRDLSGIKGMGYVVDGRLAYSGERDENYAEWADTPIWTAQLWQTLGVYGRFGAVPLLASRGCQYACRFCYNKLLEPARVVRKPSVVLADIREILAPAPRGYIFNDSSLTAYPQLGELCQMLVNSRSNPRQYWHAWGRVNEIVRQPTLLPLMHSAGCLSLRMGIESSNPEILRAMGKGITIEQVQSAIHLLRQSKVVPYGLFILGHPGETADTALATVDFARRERLANSGWHVYVDPDGANDEEALAELNFDVPFPAYGAQLRRLCEAGRLSSNTLAMALSLKKIDFSRERWLLDLDMRHTASGLPFGTICRALQQSMQQSVA